eukprot:SAG11_NODE_11309_length_769_cov_1.370149_1_plen_249_part_01
MEDIDECDSNPCNNGGVCTHSSTSNVSTAAMPFNCISDQTSAYDFEAMDMNVCCPGGVCDSTACCFVPSCGDIDQSGTPFNCEADADSGTDVIVAGSTSLLCTGRYAMCENSAYSTRQACQTQGEWTQASCTNSNYMTEAECTAGASTWTPGECFAVSDGEVLGDGRDADENSCVAHVSVWTSCDVSTCCVQPTEDMCNTFTCADDHSSADDVDRLDAAETPCVGAACDVDTCCVVPTCADTDQAATVF